MLVNLFAGFDIYLSTVGRPLTLSAAISLTVALVALLRTVRGLSEWKLAWLRWLMYGVVLSVLLSTVIGGSGAQLIEIDCDFALGVSFSILLWCWLVRGHGISLRLDLILTNLVLCLLVIEGGAQLARKVSPSPLFWEMGGEAPALLKQRMASLARSRFGKSVNRQGYFDDEFFIPGEKDWVACLVGDSFAYGVVPFDYNFSTVAERMLGSLGRRVAIHNLGIPAIGPLLYGEVMRSEVPRWKPNLTILSIYVGNDLREASAGQDFRNLSHWASWVVASRLIRWHRAAPARSETAKVAQDPGLTPTVPDYVRDWRLEPESMSRRTYEEIELGYLEICRRSTDWESRQEKLCEVIRYFQQASGGHLLLLICPTAGQVDDELYRELLSRKPHPEEFLRDYPQQQLGEFCRKEHIAYLDLLPQLREAYRNQPHLYSRNDTHWNAAGNQVVGRALGQYLNQNFRH